MKEKIKASMIPRLKAKNKDARIMYKILEEWTKDLDPFYREVLGYRDMYLESFTDHCLLIYTEYPNILLGTGNRRLKKLEDLLKENFEFREYKIKVCEISHFVYLDSPKVVEEMKGEENGKN